ncbi:MAG: glycosyltransferase family 1 protein [Advenella sp.]
MNLKRILHIIGRMDRAGAETMLMNLYREIDRTKYQFDFVYFTNDKCDYDDEIESLGGHIIRIESNNSIERFFSLLQILRKGNWNTVHSHTLFSSGLHLLAAKFSKVPILIAHSHNTSDADNASYLGRIYQNSMRWLLSWIPTTYISCGNAASKYLFPSRKDVQLIPNAIDINKFINAQNTFTRKNLNISQNKLIILQVGRLMPVKNHLYSVKIAAVLKEEKVDFAMLFVGTGPDQHAIQELISQYNLEDKIHLLGLREDIPELMAAADVMLMPSLHEGFPVVLVESQAAGLPAVIADTISNEVDLGIDLIDFLDLNSPPDVWIERIQAAKKKLKVSAEIRFKTLENNGFSAQSGADRLLEIYQKNQYNDL